MMVDVSLVFSCVLGVGNEVFWVFFVVVDVMGALLMCVLRIHSHSAAV